jgi:N-carbamoyl-L-amino-acid hydrolase
MEINGKRLRTDIERNAEFGAIDAKTGRGRTVFTGTPANKAVRDYFVKRLDEAGLDVRIDPVGNIAGRWVPETADPEADPVATGSHLDSVPRGGIFDGPLGVYGSLEAVRTLQEQECDLDRPIDVVSFTEEEGARFTALTGSKLASSRQPAAELLSLTDEDGTTLESALTDIGYRGDGIVDASEWEAWIELHVEQHTRLESRDVPVGIVTDITGIHQRNVEIRGEANHAGTTGMNERRDALAGAAEVILALERAANSAIDETSDTAVGTVGQATVEPNGTNVVPGRVRLGADIRDIQRDTMDSMLDDFEDTLGRIEADRDLETDSTGVCDIDPTPLSDRCCRVLRRAAAELGVDSLDLHSGAGHDTMCVADVTDAAMVFAPSRHGASHTPREWTAWKDCVTSSTVLAQALAMLATT